MRRFRCTCGNQLFFENTQCLICHREVGWCPHCSTLVPLLLQGDGYHCGRSECGAPLFKCHNYAVENVCNRMLLKSQQVAATHQLCDYCQLNATIPDLSVTGNREKWYRLEVAKRRLFYSLDMLELPYAPVGSNFPLPLSFEFKADIVPANAKWHKMGRSEKVYTGHARGVITINIQEADDVERERLRQQFQEAHRTLIGHFRHEIGHYYWELLIEKQREAEFAAVFGDHQSPTYAESQAKYYREGPAPGWSNQFISAYASMHPWEDFAESFAAYLDMRAVLDTAQHRGFRAQSILDDQFELTTAIAYYLQLGVMVNEFNREMGLLDLVPDVFTPAVTNKLSFIHHLVVATAQEVRASEKEPERIPA